MRSSNIDDGDKRLPLSWVRRDEENIIAKSITCVEMKCSAVQKIAEVVVAELVGNVGEYYYDVRASTNILHTLTFIGRQQSIPLLFSLISNWMYTFVFFVSSYWLS